MLQTVVGYQLFGRVIAMDLVLVVVVATALFFGPTAGMVSGTMAGLCQDALSGGVLGVAGLAKTLAGFVAGVVATQFIVSSVIPRGGRVFCHDMAARRVFPRTVRHDRETRDGPPLAAAAGAEPAQRCRRRRGHPMIERGPEWWRRRQYTRRAEGRRLVR